MGAATVVASAIVFGLVIIIAYIIVGTSLQMIDVVTSAQTTLTENQEERLRSSVEIWNSSYSQDPNDLILYIQNTGSETLRNNEYWDVYVWDTEDSKPDIYLYTTESLSPGTWNITAIWPDRINPGMIDPEENASIIIRFEHGIPPWVKITTPTGISDSWYVL